MTTNNLRNHRVDREVERLFKEHPPKYNRLCQNPVTGGNYIGIISESTSSIRRSWHAKRCCAGVVQTGGASRRSAISSRLMTNAKT